MNHDYVPGGDAEFNEFQLVLVKDTTANGDRWGISIDAVQELRTKGGRWDAAYVKTSNARDRTHADTLEKNEARADYEKEIRRFVKAYLAFNPAITDVERDKMGLSTQTVHRTPVQAPDTAPVVEIDFATRLRHTLHFRDSMAENRARPEGMHGCEIWSKLGTEPVDADELTFLALDTRSPHTVEYRGGQRGKTVWYWLRWENTHGEHGPWSAPVSAIIA